MKCSVPGCTTVLQKEPPGFSFFRFPKDERVRARWLKAIGREGWDPDYNRRICMLHFDEKYLVYSGTRKRLALNAIPRKLIFSRPSIAKIENGVTPHRQSNGVSATKRIDNFKNNVTPGSSRPFIGQDAAYTPMSDLMSESRSFSPENEQFNTSNKKKSKPSRKELRYQTDAALLQFLQNSNDTSTSKVSEKPFGEFIATELEKIQCIDIREEVKWEIQLAIRKGIQQALQTNTHSSLCSVPPNQMSMDSSDKEYFVINNVE